ncbi:dynamin family protein [Nocardia higoensis]|uniref:dynamin family protein n=1 Tax=Nocardia higoensis TaxID=228599 RepID=UPI0002D68920|nr:dynamin family protein [Nocardia higoensis]
MVTTAEPSAVPLLPVLTETIAVARAAGRADLVARLAAASERVRDPRRRIVVAGLLGQGKSRFVNALLNAEVCPVGDDATTAVPTVLASGPAPCAELVCLDPGDGAEHRVEVPLDHLGERTPQAGGRRVARQEVRLPNPLLDDGIVLVDTPGVGGRAGAGAATVLAMVPSADAVLVLSDASTELTEPELGFLRQVRELCPSVALVLTKIDLYPHWRQVRDADAAHLERAGLDLPIVPVSALLRAHAMRTQDKMLGLESGYGELYRFLREEVVARDRSAARAALARDIHSAAEHLALALGSELLALRDPDRSATAVGELRSARTAAEDLHRRTAAWQQTLADGITDLAGDVDHDLRDRLRGIARTGEEWIDDHDPGRHWALIAEWLTDAVDSALGENLLWTHKRATALADRVAEHFSHSGTVELPDVRAGVGGESGAVAAATLGELEPDIGLGSKLLVGMRGSYGGVLMVGLASTFAGLAMFNPISLGAGVLVGGKAFRDDKQARLARRRAEAKTAVRRFVDDVAFQAGKESKDRLHRIHRALRDHYAGVADRALRSIDDSLRAAQDAASMESSRRSARCEELERRLRVVTELRAYAELMGRSDQAPGSALGRVAR